MATPPAAGAGARLPRTGRALLLALLTAATVVVVAAPAEAHERLVSASPAADAQLHAPPAEVVLTFSDDPIPLGHTVVVRDETGTDQQVGAPVVDGRTVSTSVEPLPAGTYSVVWRVVSGDGHPISGTQDFTVAAAATSPGAAPPTSVPAAPSTPPSDPTTATAAAATDADAPAAPDDRTPVAPSTGWWLAAAGAAVVAVVLLGLRARRARRPSDSRTRAAGTSTRT